MDDYPPSPLCTPIRFLRVGRGWQPVESFGVTLGREVISEGGFVIASDLIDLLTVLLGDLGDEVFDRRANIVLTFSRDDFRD